MYQLIKPVLGLEFTITKEKWATLRIKERMLYIETSKLNKDLPILRRVVVVNPNKP